MGRGGGWISCHVHFNIHSLSRYDGMGTKHKLLWFMLICTVMVLELIVFSYNYVIVQ